MSNCEEDFRKRLADADAWSRELETRAARLNDREKAFNAAASQVKKFDRQLHDHTMGLDRDRCAFDTQVGALHAWTRAYLKRLAAGGHIGPGGPEIEAVLPSAPGSASLPLPEPTPVELPASDKDP